MKEKVIEIILGFLRTLIVLFIGFSFSFYIYTGRWLI